ENFSNFIIALGHEFIHAWQRTHFQDKVMGKAEREVQAHYFSIFGNKFFNEVRSNYPNYTEHDVVFPEVSDQDKLRYIDKFDSYYKDLPTDQKRGDYKQLYENVMNLKRALQR